MTLSKEFARGLCPDRETVERVYSQWVLCCNTHPFFKNSLYMLPANFFRAIKPLGKILLETPGMGKKFLPQIYFFSSLLIYCRHKNTNGLMHNPPNLARNLPWEDVTEGGEAVKKGKGIKRFY
jgi:hypothetical protein